MSVDTSKPEIMTEVASLGAHILNDIRGFEMPGALEAAAATDCGLVVMHRSATTDYKDVVAEVEAYLQERQRLLEGLGVSADRICWDPGFGFGKTVEQGAQVVRVHDCRQTVDAVAVWRASEEACGRR